jgi:hypothetical protein
MCYLYETFYQQDCEAASGARKISATTTCRVSRCRAAHLCRNQFVDSVACVEDHELAVSAESGHRTILMQRPHTDEVTSCRTWIHSEAFLMHLHLQHTCNIAQQSTMLHPAEPCCIKTVNARRQYNRGVTCSVLNRHLWMERVQQWHRMVCMAKGKHPTYLP